MNKKYIKNMTNTDLDCELENMRQLVKAYPAIIKYSSYLELLEIEAKARNVEVK